MKGSTTHASATDSAEALDHSKAKTDVLLELRDVHRSYQSGDSEVEVLHGINLKVHQGEMLAIIGPSGSGKSTLMNIIGCLDTPSSGSYYVMGKDTHHMVHEELTALRRDFFGFIFQRYHLLGHLCARENVQVPAVYAGMNRAKRDERALQLLDSLGLAQRAEYRPAQLSGGQQQRVSIARALMNGGRIILADEPTGALDSKSGKDVMNTLQDLNAKGHTIIIVTHDPRIAACARRVIAIEDGTITSDYINPTPATFEHSLEDMHESLVHIASSDTTAQAQTSSFESVAESTNPAEAAYSQRALQQGASAKLGADAVNVESDSHGNSHSGGYSAISAEVKEQAAISLSGKGTLTSTAAGAVVDGAQSLGAGAVDVNDASMSLGAGAVGDGAQSVGAGAGAFGEVDSGTGSTKRGPFGWIKNKLSIFCDRFKEAFVMAYRAMVSNRMRTLLTMLGIIIGIMAVVTVVALARGTSQRIIANISSLGTNTITIYPGERMGDVRKGRVQTLSPRDLNSLQGQPFADSVSATVQTNALIRRGAKEANATVQGVSSEMVRVYGLELKSGRLFTYGDLKDNAQVGVIDDNTAKLLFPTENPLGKSLFVDNVVIRVVGVLKETDSYVIRGSNPTVFMPYTSVMRRIVNQSYLSSIVVRIKDGFSAPVAERAIQQILVTRHGRSDFFMQSSDTIMKSIESATNTFTIMISAIAVISLVVGGIGVMNIMLVSVTERTREIGIRMAVGAGRGDILSQFLIEAVLVCIIGGLLGVILSYLAGLMIMHFSTTISLSYSLTSVIAAVLTSSIIGIVFGFMPARSASRLDPIDALARE